MLRRGRFIRGAILFCLFVLLVSCGKSDISLHVTKTILNKNEIILYYTIINNNTKDVWVCTNMDVVNNVQYNVIVCKYSNSVRIQIANREVPSKMRLEEPVYAKYVKLPSGSSLVGVVRVLLPMKEDVYLVDSYRDNTSEIEYINRLILEISIYGKELEVFNRECCRKDSNNHTAYVNCFWAMKHKAKSIRYRVSPVKLPIMIQ